MPIAIAILLIGRIKEPVRERQTRNREAANPQSDLSRKHSLASSQLRQVLQPGCPIAMLPERHQLPRASVVRQ